MTHASITAGCHGDGLSRRHATTAERVRTRFAPPRPLPGRTIHLALLPAARSGRSAGRSIHGDPHKSSLTAQLSNAMSTLRPPAPGPLPIAHEASATNDAAIT